MTPRPTDVVASAINGVRSALLRIDPTCTDDLVLRRQAQTILAQLADAPVAILIANNHTIEDV
jgi:hypothetical protein